MEGTYPLPEAQLDRFMFNVVIDYLPEDEEVAVVQQTTVAGGRKIEPLFTGEDILRFHDAGPQSADRRGPRPLRRPARGRDPSRTSPARRLSSTNGSVGARACAPRQYLVLGAKARALLHGRSHVTVEDIRRARAPVLRHRILINYRAEAEGVTIDSVIERLLEAVKGAGAPVAK